MQENNDYGSWRFSSDSDEMSTDFLGFEDASLGYSSDLGDSSDELPDELHLNNLPSTANQLGNIAPVVQRLPKKRPNEESAASSHENGVCDNEQERKVACLLDMFPDASQGFIHSECRNLQNDEDYNRFINTVMIPGLYAKANDGEDVQVLSFVNNVEVIKTVHKDAIVVDLTADTSSKATTSFSHRSISKRRRKAGYGSSILQPAVFNPYGPSDDVIPLDNDAPASPVIEIITENTTTGIEDLFPRLPSLKELPDSLPNLSAAAKQEVLVTTQIDHDYAEVVGLVVEDNVKASVPDQPGDLVQAQMGVNVQNQSDTPDNELHNADIPDINDNGTGADNETDEDALVKWTSEQTQMLINIFPHTDPSYLKEECLKMNMSVAAINEFVTQKLEANDMPTRESYEERLKTKKMQDFYVNTFSITEFLQSCPKPWEYFTALTRKCDKQKSHNMCFLKQEFSLHSIKDITKVLNMNKDNLYLSYHMLKKMPTTLAHKRSKFCTVNLPINIPFLQEQAFIKNEEAIKTFLAQQKSAKERKLKEAREAGALQQCMCCFDDEVLQDELTFCPNKHQFCQDCIVKCVEVEMGKCCHTIRCMADCEEVFSLATLQHVLKPEMFSKFLGVVQMSELKAAGCEDLAQCPFCTYATIMPPSDRIFKCLNPECLKESCRLCKEINHVPLRCDEVEKSDDVKMRTYIENKMSEALMRTCYKCGKKFVKEDGCNKMRCTCGATMCYLCRQPVKDYSHFNGQGGNEYQKCPLWSKNDDLHIGPIVKVAMEAKQEVLQANPGRALRHDPTAVLPAPTADPAPHQHAPNLLHGPFGPGMDLEMEPLVPRRHRPAHRRPANHARFVVQAAQLDLHNLGLHPRHVRRPVRPLYLYAHAPPAHAPPAHRQPAHRQPAHIQPAHGQPAHVPQRQFQGYDPVDAFLEEIQRLRGRLAEGQDI